jgi:hypothetical protein
MKKVVLGILRHVALVRNDISEERIVYIIRVTKIGEIGKSLESSSILATLMIEAIRSSESSVLSGAKHHTISEERHTFYEKLFAIGMIGCMCIMINLYRRFGKWALPSFNLKNKQKVFAKYA